MSLRFGETTFSGLMEPRLSFQVLIRSGGFGGKPGPLITCRIHPGSEALWWQRQARGVFFDVGMYRLVRVLREAEDRLVVCGH